MVLQSKKFAQAAGSARKSEEVPHHDAPISRGGDFIQVDGNHMRLSQGLPFVLAVNGGEILVHILEQFEIQLRQDNCPMLVYVEPGPNISTLDGGTSFTLFIRGRLFLVQVLRVLRQPNREKAVTLNLPSLGGTVSPESENPQVPPCTGTNRLPPADSEPPHLLLGSPNSAVKAQGPQNGLFSSSLGVM
jgi:hypothetical protein